MKENRNTTLSLSSKDSRLGVAMDHHGVDFKAVVLDRQGRRHVDGMSIGLPSLVIHECCGLSVFCLKSWIALLVVVPIDNKCLFHHGVHHLRYWHILPPIKLIFPITIPNKVPLFPTSLTADISIIKNIDRVLPWSHVGCFVWRWRWGFIEGLSAALIFACSGQDVYQSMKFAQLGSLGFIVWRGVQRRIMVVGGWRNMLEV